MLQVRWSVILHVKPRQGCERDLDQIYAVMMESTLHVLIRLVGGS